MIGSFCATNVFRVGDTVRVLDERWVGAIVDRVGSFPTWYVVRRPNGTSDQYPPGILRLIEPAPHEVHSLDCPNRQPPAEEWWVLAERLRKKF